MRHRPTYRIVVMDSQRPRDGEYIEALGHYDPRTKCLELDLDRARYWQSVGARPTGTADRLIRRVARERASPGNAPEGLVPPGDLAEIAVELANARVLDSGDLPAPPPVMTETHEDVAAGVGSEDTGEGETPSDRSADTPA